MTDDADKKRGALSRLDDTLREPVNQTGSGRYAPRMLKPIPALTVLAIAGSAGMWFMFAALARLVGQDVSWVWPSTGSIERAALFDLIRSTATLFALFGGLFAVLYAYRKQRVEEAAGHRADAEALSKRYQDAAEQLGHTAAAVRLAGAFALARLADEWEEQRQSCVAVLCACLRMAPKMTDQRVDDGEHSLYLPEDGDMEVRRTICGLISSRLTDKGLWSTYNFNLTGASLPDLKIRNATINGQFIMNRATLSGTCEMTRMTFNGGLDAVELTIKGTFKLADVLPGPSKSISLNESYIEEGAALDFVVAAPPSADAQWQVWLRDIRCAGIFALKIAKTSYAQSTLHISGLKLLPSGTFKVVETPAKDEGSAFMPVIAAEGWSTTKSSTITIPGAFRKKHVFKAESWVDVVNPQFKYAYGPPTVIDPILTGGTNEV